MPDVASTAWQVAFEAIAKRNTAVSIANADAIDQADSEDDVTYFRVRMLAFDEAGFVIERPLPGGEHDTSEVVADDTQIVMTAVDNDQRWDVRTQVIGRQRFSLNEQLSVAALRLAWPTDVDKVQRREFFRVPTTGMELSHVELQPAGLDISMSVTGNDETGSSFNAQVVDLSGGGMGMIAPQDTKNVVYHISRYRCTFQLPTSDGPLKLDARVAHVVARDDKQFEIGLQFEYADEVERRRSVEQIVAFSTWVQRQQLRQQRGR